MTKLIKYKKREMILVLVLLLASFIIYSISPQFVSSVNIINVFNNNALLGIMSLGMMMVIVTGNIDVSVGASFAVCNMVVAAYANNTGGKNPFVAVLIGMLVGAALGAVNGIFVTLLRIPAIVVTLGTMNIFRGILYFITEGRWIEGLTGPFLGFANRRVLNIPFAVYMWIAVIVITYILLYRTRLGRNVLASGGNKEAARRAGIEPNASTLTAFIYLGILTGLAASLSASKLGIAQPSNGLGYEMTLIAAAVIGGTLFSGGTASIFGTFLGMLLLGIIDNGLVLARVPLYWQDLVTGLIIILAVASSAFQSFSKVRSRRKTIKIEGDPACQD